MDVIIEPDLQAFEVPFSKDGLVFKPDTHVTGGTAEYVKGVVVDVDALEKQVGTAVPAREAMERNHGFINTILAAYNLHLPLVIRPDDVLQQITVEVGTFVVKNADMLRERLIDFKGKKNLVVITTNETPTWKEFMPAMAEMILLNVKSNLAKILDVNFTTTTPLLRVVRNLGLMRTFSPFFNYVRCTRCGIPRVKLEGTVEDWELLRDTVNAVVDLLPELVFWYTERNLRCVLDNLVETRKLGRTGGDGPVTPPEDLRRWWASMVQLKEHRGSGRPGTFFSGWISSLVAFDTAGEPLRDKNYLHVEDISCGLSVVGAEHLVGGTTFPITFKFGPSAPAVVDGAVRFNQSFVVEERAE